MAHKTDAAELKRAGDAALHLAALLPWGAGLVVWVEPGGLPRAGLHLSADDSASRPPGSASEYTNSAPTTGHHIT